MAVIVVMGHCIHKCKVGEVAKGQNYKIKPLGLDFGHTVGGSYVMI
jgi:hypothetical protein